MSLRSRFALAFALVAAVVAGLVGILSYRAAADRIQSETDRSLQTATTELLAGNANVLAAAPDPGGHDGHFADQRRMVAQTIAPNGTTAFVGGRPVSLPVTGADRMLAASGSGGLVDVNEADVGPDRFRIMTTSLDDGRGALQVAVDIDDVRRVLGGMAIQISWVSAVVLLVAAGAGWLLARRITRRLVRLASIAERVSEDGRPPEPVPVDGRDEVGRLAGAFDTMLLRLAAAREAQDRLVQDVAHELRTPLTSLRTNASVLRRFAELSPDARSPARRRRAGRDPGAVAPGGRARRVGVGPPRGRAGTARGPGGRDRRDGGPGPTPHGPRDRGRRRRQEGVVAGRERDLARAVGNLLENAAKFDADGSAPIVVSLRGATVTVADRGPGDRARRHCSACSTGSTAPTPRAACPAPVSAWPSCATSPGPRRHRVRPQPRGGGAEVGFTVDPARLLPGSEPDHVEVSPGGARWRGPDPSPAEVR